MKALAFLLLHSPTQFRSDRSWRVALITASLHQRILQHHPATHSFTPTHQVPSRWLAPPTSLRSLNDPTDTNVHVDRRINTEEEPLMLRCASSNNDSHHIYQMNAAALRKLLVTQQHRLPINGTSKGDALDTTGICNTNETSSLFIESSINFTTANENASGSCLTSTNDKKYDPEVYFVAFNGSSSNPNVVLDTIDDSADSKKSNDIHINNILSSINPSMIIGITAIQLRRKSPLIAGSSTTTSNEKDLPAVTLPTPHFYVLGVQVDEQFRQCGVGSSLLASIVEYCRRQNMQPKEVDSQQLHYFGNENDDSNEKKECEDNYVDAKSSQGGNSTRESSNSNREELLYKLQKRQQQRKVTRQCNNIRPETYESLTIDEERVPIVLSVDSDNTPALRLYEKFGFKYLEQNSVFCMMAL